MRKQPQIVEINFDLLTATKRTVHCIKWGK